MVPIQWVWWAPHTMSRVTWLVPGVPGVPCAPTLVPGAGAGTGRTLPPPPAGAATAPPPPAAGAGRVGRKPAALAAPAVIRAAPVMLTITQVFTLFGRREDIWHLSRVVARRVHAAGRR